VKLELIAFKGSEYLDPKSRNIEVVLFNEHFDLDEDLLVFEFSNQIDKKEYILDKNGFELFRLFIPKSFIKKIKPNFYLIEMYLDDMKLNNNEFKNEQFLIRCSLVKKYKENYLFDSILADNQKLKPLFEVSENSIKNKTQIFSVTGRSNEAKLKQLIKTRGIPDSNLVIDNKHKEEDSLEVKKIDFSELEYRLFVDFAVLLGNSDGVFTKEEQKTILTIAPDYLKKTKIDGILKYSIEEYRKNKITFSKLILQINKEFDQNQKNALLNSLYKVAISDGEIDTEELKLLELISNKLNIDFKSLKNIQSTQLKKVKIIDTSEDFSDLEIDFEISKKDQIVQAKELLNLWISRLNNIVDPRFRSEVQLKIDKLSRFLSKLEDEGFEIIEIKFNSSTNYSPREEDEYEDDDYKFDEYEEDEYEDDDYKFDEYEEDEYEDDDYEVYSHSDSEYKKLLAKSKIKFRLPSPTSDTRVMKIRKTNKRAYAFWSDEEENFLIELFEDHWSYEKIAKILQRQTSAIVARLSKLELIDENYLDW